MNETEVIQELRSLRRDLKLTEQATSRKIRRVGLLNENNLDFGEEGIRLDQLQPNLPSLRTQITEAIAQIKSGEVAGEEAMNAYYGIASEIKFAQSSLDDIRVPNLNRVWAAETRNAY